MRVLYTAFKGKTNSSKLLLDYINGYDKLYLTNSYETSVRELKRALEKNNYDFIISLGQSQLNMDTIKIEIAATDIKKLKTKYDYNYLKSKLENKYKVIVSSDCGKYLCNNIYYYGLKYIKENQLKTKMVFIHIPKKDKISDFEVLAKYLTIYKLEEIKNDR